MGYRSTRTREQRMRAQLVREAARLMVEDGVRDYAAAKRKAARRLGAEANRNLPRNLEIEQAVREYQAVFCGDNQPLHLLALRRRAIEAMEFFAPFRPRLVGPVLSGTADEYSEIQLHLFADTAETVLCFLLDHNVPYVSETRRVRYKSETWALCPTFRFLAGETEVVLTVFSEEGLREAPQSEVHGRPMERASLAEVRRLVAASTDAPDPGAMEAGALAP